MSLLKDISPESTIFITATAHGAIEILEKESNFDYIFLDHDLGGQAYVESGPGTGWFVAEYMAENEVKCDHIIVHTLNYPGAQNMLALLPTARHIPYNLLVRVLAARVREIKSQIV